MIQRETMKTSSTVPGQMVISVFSTNLVLKLILLRAPMLRELASVNSLEWSSMTLSKKYIAVMENSCVVVLACQKQMET